MNLPDEIPETLRRQALSLPGLSDGQGAWGKEDALGVVTSLRSTTVAISEAQLFDRVTWGYAPSDRRWFGERLIGEADPDYAQRTRHEVSEFMSECEVESEDAVFVLTFPMEKDAA